jgi:PAS domain S-box-containing protein
VDFHSRKFISVNEAMCRMTGYSREELLVLGPDGILEPASRKVFRERVTRWLKGKKPDENVTYRLRRKDGQSIDAALKVKFTAGEQGKPAGAIGIVQDITERIKYEQDLIAATRRAEQHQTMLETIIRQMPAGIIISNASGSEKKVNQEMDRIWKSKSPPKANIDAHAGRAFHPDGREYRLDEWPLARTLRKGEVVIGEEMNILRRDNSRGTVLINASPIRDKDGSIMAGVTIFITASAEGETRTASLNLNGAAAMSPLPAPTPVSPVPGATVIHDGPVEFAWSDVTGAVSYTIEVQHSGSFDGPLAASRTVPAPRITISPIAPGTVWWRVRANDSSGAPGRWSAARPLQLR